MSHLLIECHSGISGDMTLGALVALGADLERIVADLESLPVKGFRLSSESVKRKGVMGTLVRVEVDEAKDTHRTWPQVRDIITAAGFPERVERRSLAAFETLARAEATVHGTDLDKIHFHEVGCLDAIVDVAGSMLALEQLGVDRVWCSPLNVGRGSVTCRHGVMPVPAPATAEILKGVPIYQNDLEGELVTPTGAAIAVTLAEGFGASPLFIPEKTGYGSGTREHPDRPNYLRASLGRFDDNAAPAGLEHQRLRLITTEMDDESGEVFTALFDRLFEGGALDVNLLPLQMKKGRPGVSLQVLCDADAASSLVETVLNETSTFGVKVMEVDRYCLPRAMESVATSFGDVAVKVGRRDGAVVKAKPEFDDCRRLAETAGAPVRAVLSEASARIVDKYFSGGSDE